MDKIGHKTEGPLFRGSLLRIVATFMSVMNRLSIIANNPDKGNYTDRPKVKLRFVKAAISKQIVSKALSRGIEFS